MKAKNRLKSLKGKPRGKKKKKNRLYWNAADLMIKWQGGVWVENGESPLHTNMPTSAQIMGSSTHNKTRLAQITGQRK